MSDEVIQEIQDNVMRLTINRPDQRNAINAEVISGLSAGIEEANADVGIRAVVLTGAGEKAFCAGGDLKTETPFSVDYSNPYAGAAQLFRQARQSTVPMIARINGTCLAGGMGFMAMCDLVIAAKHAVFGLPEVKVGVFPAQVMSVLQHLVPRRVLSEMCLLGDSIDADSALRFGLINAVADDLDGEVATFLSRLLKASPTAIRRGLYTLKKMESMPFEESMAFSESQIALFALTDDAKEGQAAFREKRAPSWTDK